MNRQSILTINIPKPCLQDWDNMPASGNGKHCSQCNNIIYDFSELSDNALILFFKQRPDVHCGRFHNSQLHRNILPQKKKKIRFFRFNKIAAAFFAALNFQGIASQGANGKPAIIFNSKFKAGKVLQPGKIIISGTIKDGSGKALENAAIIFDSVKVAVSGKNGEFSFELNEVNADSHTLYFMADSFITTVRSYHPAMLSVSYDIILYKHKKNLPFRTMGIVDIAPVTFPSILFKKKEIYLNKKNKAMLDEVVYSLKNNPEIKIVINAYPPEHIQDTMHIIKARLSNIVNYLVNQGISADRLNTTIAAAPVGEVNVIDIVNLNE